MPDVSSFASSAGLTEDAVDDILYLARTNSLEDLKEELATLSAQKSTTALAIVTATTDSATGNTPAHLAAANGHVDVLKYLQSLNSPDSSLLTAPNAAGSSPLHYAAVNARIDAVKSLVEALAQGPMRDDFIRLRNAAGRDAAAEAENAGRDGWEEVVGYLLGNVDPGPEPDEAVKEEEVDAAKDEDVPSKEIEDLDIKR